MFLPIFLAVLVCANAKELVEPKFQVLTPDELMVQVPHYENKKLVTFRIGVRRAGHDEDDLELGENDIDNDRVFIYDQRLDLKEGDVVNYLLVFKDKRGYQAQSGNYYFNGVYYKNSYGRRNRFRRDITTTEDTPTEKSQDNTDDTEEFNPVEPRFGGGHYPHHGHHFPNHHHNHGFNPWGAGPRQPYPGFPPQGGPPPFGGPPSFGRDCNDHRHDMCHGRDNERWSSSTIPSTQQFDVGYLCQICDKHRGSRRPDITTRRTTTSTEEESPDIDIRFSD